MINFKNIILKNTVISLEQIENEVGALNGINIKFGAIDQDHIYQTSEGATIQNYPQELATKGIDLDLKALITLNMAITNTISTYLYALRKPLNQGEMNLIIKSSFEKEKYLKVNVTKYFFRDKSKGRYKINISIMENDLDFGEYESIMFSFTKKDVQVLQAMIKDITSSYARSKVIFINGDRVSKEDHNFIEEVTVPIVKIDNSIVIDSIWLHGQEILNIMYIVDKLVNNMGIEEDLKSINTFYRQIQVINENGICYLLLKKMNRNHQEELLLSSTGEEYILKLVVSAQLLTILNMFVGIKILRHSDAEFDYDPTVEILGSQDPFVTTRGIKYHISLKESFLGVAVTDRQKDNSQVISFVGQTKEGVYSLIDEEGMQRDSVFMKDDKIINVLTEFKIDLRDQWPKLIKALSLAYTKEYITEDNDFNFMKFFVINNDAEGRYKYEFSILSNKENKAAAVLIINKYKLQNREEVFMSSFRQPLFDRYVYQLLVMFMASSEFIDNIEYTSIINKKDIIQYRYKSMKNVIKLTKNEEVEYGLKKISNKTFWGIFSDNNEMFFELNRQDRYLLSESSFFRIIRGYWLPFVGDYIAIGPDKFLTDIHGEVDLEKDNAGLDWGLKLYFGSSE